MKDSDRMYGGQNVHLLDDFLHRMNTPIGGCVLWSLYKLVLVVDVVVKGILLQVQLHSYHPFHLSFSLSIYIYIIYIYIT